MNDRVCEAALYMELPDCPAGAVAVILHKPAPVTVPFAVLVDVPTVHGPDAVKLTGSPDVAVAVTVNTLLPYCTLGSGPKVMFCDCVVEPCGRIMNVPDTGVAAL